MNSCLLRSDLIEQDISLLIPVNIHHFLQGNTLEGLREVDAHLTPHIASSTVGGPITNIGIIDAFNEVDGAFESFQDITQCDLIRRF